jgi:hypothetical protein
MGNSARRFQLLSQRPSLHSPRCRHRWQSCRCVLTHTAVGQLPHGMADVITRSKHRVLMGDALVCGIVQARAVLSRAQQETRLRVRAWRLGHPRSRRRA